MKSTRVESMADGTRGTQAIAKNRRTTRLLSPRGSSVSANGSQRRTDHPKTTPVLVRTPMLRRSHAVSGFRPNWSPGVVVGAMIGWLLDRWLGISPWGLIVFLLLGFAAGVLNVMRAAGVVRERNLTD